MSTYYVLRHVFLCVNADQILVLDLKNNEYSALDPEQALALGGLVRGWPLRADGTVGTAEAEALAAKWMREGVLLTTDRRRGKEATPVQISRPSEVLLQSESIDQWKMRPRHIAAFVYAMMATLIERHLIPLRWTVRYVAWRKARRARLSPCPLERAKELMAIFRWLRPFGFSAKDHCLFDSLALVNFLACFRVFPEWVFAVDGAPFAAHSWVQHGPIVFNDGVEIVERYTPIMVI